jgi:hypothetical protein
VIVTSMASIWQGLVGAGRRRRTTSPGRRNGVSGRRLVGSRRVSCGETVTPAIGARVLQMVNSALRMLLWIGVFEKPRQVKKWSPNGSSRTWQCGHLEFCRDRGSKGRCNLRWRAMVKRSLGIRVSLFCRASEVKGKAVRGVKSEGSANSNDGGGLEV